MKKWYEDERDVDRDGRLQEIVQATEYAFALYEAGNVTEEGVRSHIKQYARLLQVAEKRADQHYEEGSFKDAYKYRLLSLTYQRSALVYKSVLRGREFSARVKWQEALADMEAQDVLRFIEELEAGISSLPIHDFEWFTSNQNIRSETRRGGYQAVITPGTPDHGVDTWDVVIINVLGVSDSILPPIRPDRKFHSVAAAQNWAASRL